MVNVALADRFAGGAGGAGFTAGLLAVVAPPRSLPDSKIRGRIIVEN
jgi:hypothetical protein